MTKTEFLAEFLEEHFPSRLGPLMDIDSHDPPFNRSDLRRMAADGLIVLNEDDWTYRLTLAATDEMAIAKSK